MAQPAEKQNSVVAIGVVVVVAGMLGLSFAAVPLYKIFCQVTGYGGTTQVAKQASGTVLDKTVTVRFDANVSNDMAWKFKPVQQKIVVRIGENRLAHYRATNLSNKPVTGTATFNVTPLVAGSYFSKIACFCFTEQTLQPGETVDMPVSFYIDPDFATDPDTASIREITLSYTFFPVKKSVKTVSR